MKIKSITEFLLNESSYKLRLTDEQVEEINDVINDINQREFNLEYEGEAERASGSYSGFSAHYEDGSELDVTIPYSYTSGNYPNRIKSYYEGVETASYQWGLDNADDYDGDILEAETDFQDGVSIRFHTAILLYKENIQTWLDIGTADEYGRWGKYVVKGDDYEWKKNVSEQEIIEYPHDGTEEGVEEALKKAIKEYPKLIKKFMNKTA